MGLKFNKAEFAKLFDKSPRWLGKLITDEDFPVESGGGKGQPLIIDSAEGINWLIREAVSKAVGMREGEDGADGEFQEGTRAYEDYHTAKAKRIQEQIKTKKSQDLSIDIEELKPLLFEVANIYGQQNDAMAGRLSSELASIDDPAFIKSRILEESRRIRALTSERLLNFCARYRGNVSTDSDGEATRGS